MMRPYVQLLAGVGSWLLFLPALADAVGEFDFSDPQYGKRLGHFVVESREGTMSRFMCKDKGARCVFRRESYTTYDFTSGQQTDNTQGAVWSPLEKVNTATLDLGACKADNCIVTCNANCTCVYSTDDFETVQNCTEVASRAPTEAPVVEEVKEVCPRSEFIEFCPELMQNLEMGLEDEFDCYNFCGGVFTSTCDFGGGCGKNKCKNNTATGTMYGQVYGCTAKHLTSGGVGGGDGGGSANDRNNPNGQNGQNGASSGLGYSVKVTSALLVATFLFGI